ncbi:MAG TPA: hypothetical protein VHQ90_19625 [Thermoanaerobaculia bacterium]|nr:hypothetical protein [Thermoanaerobaculia bacterium]
MRRLPLGLWLAAALLWISTAAGAAPPRGDADSGLLAGLKARSIGPAAMSGRIAAVAGVASDPNLLYAGAAIGGVWKSVNRGLTWTPIFDDQPVSSIGAVAVFQPNPDIVWVGTGEGNPRNSASVGNGVYRSLDGGRTWQHLGLDATERISRIVLHPRDPNVAFVAALGREWGENPERGVYKTSDGGRTWKRVLYADERSGAAELAMDPTNPNKLFAALWDFRRWPWFFRSGGPGSGLYVTYDGGDSWKRLSEDDGLPKGTLGRIGLAIAPSEPRVVYALVEAQGKNSILRSEDGGRSWKVAGTDTRATERPFYYATLRVDPEWPNRVYSLTSRLVVSNDSGKTFGRLGHSNDIHGDYHTLWINPADANYLVAGEDGGLGISHDRGETWAFVGNLPLGQYYHVSVDMDTPYHIYGGMQDNGSWRGPSSVWERGEIRNEHWVSVGGGDGFGTLSDPADSQRGYAMSQGGALTRFDLKSGERKIIRPPDFSPDPAKRLRFNWNAGIAQDPFEPGTIYYGSQYLHRSADRGETWTMISPDLTSNKPEWQRQSETGGLTPDQSAAENYTTIIAIAPSALERGLIWVGTDDGRVQLTRDGGKNWTSVEGNIPGVPAHTWVPQIRASKLNAGGAFVVFDDHRRSNWTPYVFRTDDYGKTWKSLAAANLRGYALAIEQDPVDRDLLFLGTEFGLYVSWNGGGKWQPWKHGLPTISVMDLVVHPRDHDLVIGTHGRSAYVLDDIAPLREVSAATLREPLHLYPVSPAQEHYRGPAFGPGGAGSGEFRGENRPYGALLTYSLNLPNLPLADEKQERERKQKQREQAAAAAPAPAGREPSGAAPASPASEDQPPAAEAAAQEAPERAGEAAGEGEGEKKGPQVDIRITDAAGKTVRTLHGPANLGVNRAVWDLGRDEFRQPPREERGFRFETSGPQVAPGTYGVVVKYAGQEAKGTVRVLADPSTRYSDADWQAREAANRRTGELQEALVEAISRIAAARADIAVVLDKQRRADAARKRAKAGDEDRAGEAGAKAGAPPAEKTGEKTGDKAAGATSRKDDAPLTRSARQLQKKLSDTERHLFIPPGTKGIVDDRTPLAKLQLAELALISSWGPPNATQKAYAANAEAAVAAALEEVNRLFATDVAAFRKQLADAKIDLLTPQEPLALPKSP